MTRRRPGQESGSTLIEYALLIVLIALACFASLQLFGGNRNDSLSRSGSTIFTDR